MKKSSKPKTHQEKNSIKGNINIQGDSDNSNYIIGDNNKISITTEQSKLPSLYQLPPKIADFTGRKALVDELLKDIERNKGAAINSLTGMGGIGKTALGLEVAHNLAEKYPDGQIFLDLKGTTSPISTLDIMRYVILSFDPTADLRTSDEANLIRVYRSVLHNKKVLLYFDNARSSEQVANLLPPTSCIMLVTSRWVFPLTGLKNYKVGIFNEEEALAFLNELCPRINEEESATLAWACGYLPLALRIAGSFLQVNTDWQVSQYLERLADFKSRLKALQESRKEAEMAEEFDLVSTFDLSYNQLAVNEQRSWRLISVFQTSFNLEAAMYLWDTNKNEAQKLLGKFRRYSLLDFNESLARYEFHDLLSEFAHTKIKNPELKLAKSRHSIYYSEIIDHIVLSAFSGDNFIKALRIFDLEMENIISGFWFAISKNDARFLRAVITYARPIDILKLRLHPLEIIKWSTQGLAAARKLGDLYALAGHYGDLGITYLDLGEINKSIECHKKSMTFAQKIDDKRARDLLIGNALGNLGQAYESKGDLKTAKQHHEEALALSRKYGNQYSEAMDLLNLGNVKSKIGENDDAIELILKAKEIFTDLDFSGKIGSCLVTLGNVYTRLQKIELALNHLEEARKIFTELGDLHNLGACIQNIGNAYIELKKFDIALVHFKEAKEIAILTRDYISTAQRLANIGATLFQSQRQTESLPYFEQAILISKEIEAHELTFMVVRNLSAVYMELNEKDKAKNIIRSAMETFPEGSIYLLKTKFIYKHLSLFDGRDWKDFSDTEKTLWIIGQVRDLVEANEREEARKYISQLRTLTDIPSAFQNLGHILQKYINGDKNLDLSGLPKEIAEIAKTELNLG